jgi:hypothetical protein
LSILFLCGYGNVLNFLFACSPVHTLRLSLSDRSDRQPWVVHSHSTASQAWLLKTHTNDAASGVKMYGNEDDQYVARVRS